MDRSEVRLLQEFREYPSVSIFLSVYSGYRGGFENRWRLEKLIHDVQEQLHREIAPRDAQPILDNIFALAKTIDFRNNRAAGLALLANRHFAKKYSLPFLTDERVVISETFALRKILQAACNSIRYRVLVISDRHTKLLTGSGMVLKEANTSEFPMRHHEPEGVSDLIADCAVSGCVSAYIQAGGIAVPCEHWPEIALIRDELMRRFLLQVDQNLCSLIENDSAPLIVVASERNVALYLQVTRHSNRIAGVLQGAFTLSNDELQLECYSLVKRHEQSHVNTALQEFKASIKSRQYATGICDVWQTANQGRCKTVLVEKSYYCPAAIQAGGSQIQPLDRLEYFSHNMLPDAVDALIGTVLSGSGDICFVEDGTLKNFDHVAAVLRY